MMSAPFKPLPIPPSSNTDKAGHPIPAIEELVRDTQVEAFLQSCYDQTTILSGEAYDLRPITVERFRRLLKILRNKHSSSSESNKKTIHKALHSFLKSLETVVPVSFSVRCDESDCSVDDALGDAPRPLSGYGSPTPELITLSTHEPGKCQQVSVEVVDLQKITCLAIDTPHKGGRPPKNWPPSGRRLLVRFVTAGFPKLTLVQQALKQDGFAVSIRHIEGKVREMFGSRKSKDADFDRMLRPKDSAQMDNRVRAFVECQEQWRMLRKRAVLESPRPVPSSISQADTFDNTYDDQQTRFAHLPKYPTNDEFQAELQSPSTSRQEYSKPLDCIQTTLPDKRSLVSLVEADTDFSMIETGGFKELDLNGSSSLSLDGCPTSLEQQTHASFNAGRFDAYLPKFRSESFSSPDDQVHEETLPTTPDILECNGFMQNPTTTFDNLSYGSLSSSGYEGSSVSARDLRRASNREAQRLCRQRMKQKSQQDTSNNREQDLSRLPRVSQACERCRRLKIKCTSAKPTCGNCIRLPVECVYVQKAASIRRPNLLDNSDPLPSPLGFHNRSANSFNSSIGASRMSVDGSSQASIYSSFAPSPSVKHHFPQSDPGKRKDSNVTSLGGSPGASIMSPRAASSQIQSPSLNPGARKEGAIKRYLRSKFNPGTSSNLSTTSLLESRKILEASGAASSDHINLHNICSALSASSLLEASDMELIHYPPSHTTGEPCWICDDKSCLQVECLHELMSITTAYEHQDWIDVNGNTNLHRAVQHGRKSYVAKLLELGADPCAKNKEGMNPAVYGWGFLVEHREDDEKYKNIWLCMLRVLEKQREVAPSL